MTGYMVGGRRRIDRVLAPGYAEHLDTLTMDELRARKVEADQEETDLSYARRLLQGRIDILLAEFEARENGEPGLGGQAAGEATDAELVERLSKILTAGAPRPDARGLGRHLELSPTRAGESRREEERAIADVSHSNVGALSAPELDGALKHLRDVERRISDVRRQVQRVADALTSEIAARYQRGEVPLTLS